jgi:hypothetical protein
LQEHQKVQFAKDVIAFFYCASDRNGFVADQFSAGCMVTDKALKVNIIVQAWTHVLNREVFGNVQRGEPHADRFQLRTQQTRELNIFVDERLLCVQLVDDAVLGRRF